MSKHIVQILQISINNISSSQDVLEVQTASSPPPKNTNIVAEPNGSKCLVFARRGHKSLSLNRKNIKTHPSNIPYTVQE